MAVHSLEGGNSTRSKVDAMTYDPTSGSWSPSSTPTTTSKSSTESVPKSKTPSGTNTTVSSNNVDSQSSAEKEYIDIEFNTLTGDLSVTPSEKAIRVKINDTVQVEGLGSYLSGLYFVQSVRRTITKDGGYTHSFGLLKNGFGTSVKKPTPLEEATPTPKPTETRKEEVKKSTPEFKVGDKVKIVGADAVYSNAHDGVKVPEWVKKKTHTVDGISSDKTRVRLKEIWSWTYVKYLKKV